MPEPAAPWMGIVGDASKNCTIPHWSAQSELRSAFLAQACGGDQELLGEVQDLIAHDRGFLQ